MMTPTIIIKLVGRSIRSQAASTADMRSVSLGIGLEWMIAAIGQGAADGVFRDRCDRLHRSPPRRAAADARQPRLRAGAAAINAEVRGPARIVGGAREPRGCYRRGPRRAHP